MSQPSHLISLLPIFSQHGFIFNVICDSFDYIIVGAGTAGLVVANRLSENPNITVVVMEPGPDVRDFPGVQAAFPPGAINASIDWAYTSIPQPRLNNRTFQYHAGRAIGGSSTINGSFRLSITKVCFTRFVLLVV